MKYIKLFDTHSEYETYINDEPILPNVSVCVDNDDIHYNHWIDPRIVVKFNIINTSSPTNILYSSAVSQFSKIEIDDVEIPEVTDTYTFDIIGEHTVKYTLVDQTAIGQYAFNGCTNIISVTIPNTVKTIAQRSFFDCTGLTSVTIGSGVTSIANETFNNCADLTNISVDINNTVYDSRNNCNAIIETATNTLITGCKNTVIPDSVTSIGSSAFYGCTGLTSITIPDSVTSIGSNAFGRCTGLTSITIPSGVTRISQYAFQYCSNLTSVTLNSNSIVSRTYTSTLSLKDDFGNQVTQYIIGDGVTSIGNYVFYYCTGLTSVTIPDSVTSIGSNAFGGCSGLTSITSHATTAPTIANNTFRNVKTGGTLYVPIGSTGYDVWMGTGNYYLGLYNWTKVEQ